MSLHCPRLYQLTGKAYIGFLSFSTASFVLPRISPLIHSLCQLGFVLRFPWGGSDGRESACNTGDMR